MKLHSYNEVQSNEYTLVINVILVNKYTRPRNSRMPLVD